MTWQWTSQFEKYPIGNDLGSVTSYEIRRHKEAIEERITVEHSISAADPPVIAHRVGQCAVVHEESEETATVLLVDGALQYHAGLLKRDTGVALVAVSAASHLGLIAVADSENEHPDYIAINHSDTFETLLGNLDMNGNLVTGLAQSGFDDEAQVLSRGGHLGNHVTTGCKHNDESITSLSGWVDMDGEKLKLTDHDHVINTTGWHDLNFGRFATFPVLASARPGVVQIGLATNSEVDDYQGRLQVYCPENETYTLNYKRLNVS